MVQYEATSALK